MGGLIDMEHNICESLECSTHHVTFNIDPIFDLDLGLRFYFSAWKTLQRFIILFMQWAQGKEKQRIHGYLLYFKTAVKSLI